MRSKMRSFGILPSLNGNDKPGGQAASTSDVRKLANRCWNTNQSKTAPPPQPVPGPGWDESRPTSIRSLPILPSQRTSCGDVPNTLHQNKHSHSGLRGSSTEPFPAIPIQCRTSSKQSSLSLPRTDVATGRRGKRKKPSRRYREVFVWDHGTSTGSHPGPISITKETNISSETNNSMGLDVDNYGRNIYTPNGQARLKRKQRTQGLLGMLDRPLKLDQLCKSPIPHTALTNESSSKMSFPSNTIVLPSIGQNYDTSTSGYNPRSEREFSETTRVEEKRKIPAKRKTQAKKNVKSKMAQKEQLKTKACETDVKHEGTSNGAEDEDDDYDGEDDGGDGDDGGGDDKDDNSDMGWTDGEDGDDDDYESVGGFLVSSRMNSQLRKSACSISQLSRASGFTMSSVEIKMSGDDGDEDEEEGDEEDDDDDDDDDDESSKCFDGSQVRTDLDDQDNDDDDNGGDNEEKEDDFDNDSEDHEDEGDADDTEVEEMEDETINDSDDEEDDDMFVRISDYGESEDENEEENTTDAGDTAINGTEYMSDAEELDDGDENDEDDNGNDDETSTYVEDDEASNN